MNYYRAVEKKPEHGGGWAFMQLNRRSGAAIVCQCGNHPDPWTQTGHATAEEAERCFYVAQVEKGVVGLHARQRVRDVRRMDA